MSSAESPAEPTQPAPAAIDDASLQQTLRLLIDVGVQLARDLAADSDTPIGERAVAYERVSRAVRRTIILAHHLAQRRAQRPPAAAPRRARRTRDAEAALANRTESPERLERPEQPERPERPETVDLERRFFARPIPEIVAALQRALRPRRTRRRPARRPAHQTRPQAAHPRAKPPYRGPPRQAERA